jgi:hypothetical protein
MKLKYVTLTGADNTTSPEKLVELSLKYPFVEWAILFSKSKAGHVRYPTEAWVDEMISITADQTDMNFSAHLCGKWVEDVIAGQLTFLQKKEYNLRFNRLQLNMGKERLQSAIKNKTFIDTVMGADKQVILGGNYNHITVSGAFFDHTGLYPLFDASGGRGVEAKEWPKPLTYTDYDPSDSSKDTQKTLFCGYAGGLGPDNVVAELDRIKAVAGDATIWIDMESRLRTVEGGKDIFDLEKCERVLQAAKPFVG